MKIKKSKTTAHHTFIKSCDACPYYVQKENYNNKHPLFSFEHLQKDYGLDNCEKDEQNALIKTIVQLSALTWADIQKQHRHKLGSEIIDRKSLHIGSFPPCVTEDTKIIAFRFSGIKPMLGFRFEDIFYVLWLDAKMKLYDHG